MKIKWNGQTINIKNETNDRKDFYCTWNYYTICVTYDKDAKRRYKKDSWDAICIDPNGGYLVDNCDCSSLREGIQTCFDNIEYPLTKIGDCEEDEDTLE